MTAKKAFSLLELSIVIIIVSTITGAVYQGRLLYQKTKLEAARSITSGSPVASVNGLALWLDTTSPDAFTKSYSNDDSIDQWNDTNPQKTSANFAIQTNQSLQPLYVFSGINGLPSIECDGVDDKLTISAGSAYFGSSSPTISNNFTLFLVAEPKKDHEIDTQANSGNSGISGQKYVIEATDGNAQYLNPEIAGMGLSLGKNGVSVYENSGSYVAPIAVYSGSLTAAASVITVSYSNKTPSIFVNGGSAISGLASTKNSIFPSNQFCSGQYGAFEGQIGEIIIYNNQIPQNKRQQIEKYLGKKWGIKIG